MKRRKGFVTNSSSSSFILIIDNDSLKQSDGVISSIEALNNWFVSEYGRSTDTIEQILLEESKWINERYNKYKSIVESGKSIMFDSLSSDDMDFGFERIMNNLGYELEWEDM